MGSVPNAGAFSPAFPYPPSLGHTSLGILGMWGADRKNRHSSDALTASCSHIEMDPQQPGSRQPSEEPVYTSVKAQGEPWSVRHLCQLDWLEAAPAQGRP